jgi:hypothetical protein
MRVTTLGIMKTKFLFLSLLAWLTVSPHPFAQTPNWQLVWSDEFSGSSIDPSNWTYDTGGGGWGNNELEFYTSRSNNSFTWNTSCPSALIPFADRRTLPTIPAPTPSIATIPWRICRVRFTALPSSGTGRDPLRRG